MVLRRAVLASVCALLPFLIAGCGAAPNTGHSIPVVNSQYSGAVHGGQQPVVGATIQLYTVGTTADGSAATPLLTSTVTSDATGSFTITGLYSCANATQVYIVATGGNPGLSTTNPNIALMAALGPCSSLTPSTFISINELTTVAAVAALAPYMTSATAISSSSSDATPLANAFTVANQFVNTTTGLSPGNVPSGYTVPVDELNTLADILSACINSTGGVAGDGSLCGQLFSLTTISPNPAPTNTIAAMLNIANNPTLNTSALYALTPPTPPFQPTLTSAPTDFSISLQGSSTLQASVSAINFQDVTVDTFSPVQTITIANYNSLGNITVVGDNPNDFPIVDITPVQNGNCQAGAQQTCWFQVEARPSAAGIRNATIAIDYNSNSTLYIPLSVTGIASTPNSILSTSIIDFPPTITGTSSTPIPVTLNNTGTATLSVSSISISGAANNNFTQTNNCSSVAVNASCTIYVTFAPTATGVQTATLQAATASGPYTVSLSGNGLSLGTTPTLWPSNLSFTIWGANEDLTVINSGTTSMSVSNPGVGDTGGAGDLHSYAISSNGCTSTLAAGQTCTFSVQNVLMMNLSASPLQPPPGGVTGQAFINPTTNELTSDIITNSGPILLQNGSQFNGSSVAGNMSFPSTNVGSSATATIELANFITQVVNGQPQTSIGGSPVASLAIGGANPGDFSVSAVTSSVSSTPASFCPSGTAPCNITVTFTPTADGTRTAKILLDPPGALTGQYIYVTATAIGPGPHFTVNSSSISLTSYYPVSTNPNSVGSTQLTLTNIGTTTIDLAASFTGANPSTMSANVSNCSSVAPQATCTFTVDFSGSAVGSYSANLVLNDASSTFSLSIPITASTGYWPPLVSPSLLSFGNQPVGSSSTKQFFRVMDGEVAVNHPISVSLQSNSNFTLPDGSTCPASSDETCSLSVAFAPQAAGSVTEYATITDTTDNLQTQVQLTGTGVSPDYTLSAYSVAFPPQTVGTSSTTSVTLTNVSTHSITVSGVSVVGAFNGNFTETNNCSTIAANGTCSINITFVPNAGMNSAFISISSNASNSVAGINVSGTGQ